ncbi:MAG: hypothetical protein ACI4D3_08820 [Lachnospiraceae bacterium]
MEQKKERLEDWADNRKAHMKDMPWKDRVKWYVTYYWIQALAAALVIGLAGYFIWINTAGKKETWMGGAIINMPVDTNAVDEMEEIFGESQELTKKQLMTLDSSYTLDVVSDNLSQNNIGNLTKIQAYYATGDLDLIIAPETTVSYLDEREYTYRNLEEVLGKDFIAQLDEELLWYSEDENGNAVVSGISLEGTDFLEKICPEGTGTDDKIYAGIPYTAAHADHAAEFLKYVLGQENGADTW